MRNTGFKTGDKVFRLVRNLIIFEKKNSYFDEIVTDFTVGFVSHSQRIQSFAHAFFDQNLDFTKDRSAKICIFEKSFTI